MTELALFASTFVTVFALGFQSRNVNQGHYLLAAVTSLFIGGASLVLYKMLPEASITQCAAYLVGGVTGITSSIYVHTRWFTRKHAPQKGTPMRPKNRGTEAAPATPAIAFPIRQVNVGDLVDRMSDVELVDLLGDSLETIFNSYLEARAAFLEKMKCPEAFKLKPEQRHFRGVDNYQHPLNRNAWAVAPGGGDHHLDAQLDRAIKVRDWQEVFVLATMHCVREMLYGRAVEAKPAPAPKAKAVRKTAQKKPAAKKPGRKKVKGYSWSPTPPRAAPAPAKKAAPGKVATLKDLVAQAKPLFEKNPKLDRQGLINKIGRRYERLTTFDELRTLCAGKTVTTHSVKKTKAEKAQPLDPNLTGIDTTAAKGKEVDEWPFPTGGMQARKPRPRRDPAPKAPAAGPSTPPTARIKPWPQPIPGTKLYPEDLAEHAAEFTAGEVSARFTALETESGWTHGCRIDVEDKRSYSQQLREDGPLAQDPDTAIRDCTADALSELKHWLKDSEPPTEAAKELAPHVADMLKLRSWLLGFQARSVEKIAFLKKQPAQLDLAA